MNKVLLIGIIALGFSINVQAQQLDQKDAQVSLEVGKYAKINGLDDFVLSTSDADGSAGAIYSGFDDFQLESNTAVQVVLTGGQLSNGADSIPTSYNLDGGDMDFDTAAGVHNATHRVNAQATLGNISDQEAGDYAADIQITVSALIN